MSSPLRNTALQALQGEKYFRWRGGDVSRLEGITDAVIALAMTLLIVSLEMPESFDQLVGNFRQLPAFAVCFLLLGMIWQYHFRFHRRFGLENGVVIALNSALLFLILFYVYPLKYLFTELFDMFLFGERPDLGSGGELMVIYSSGVVGIFLLFLAMNAYAYRRRDVLELDEVERILTRAAVREHGIHVVIGLASIGLALAGQPALAGLVYFLVGPSAGFHGWLTGRAVRRAAAE